MLTTIFVEYLRSFSSRAGEMNRNNSYIMSGDAHNKPKYIDVDRWVTNWLDKSVAIKSISKSSNRNEGSNLFMRFSTLRYVMKEESLGASIMSNVLDLKQNIKHEKTNVTPNIRNNICRRTSKCPPKDNNPSSWLIFIL